MQAPAPCNIERITDGQNVMRNIRTQTLPPPTHALGRGEEVGVDAIRFVKQHGGALSSVCSDWLKKWEDR